MQHLILIGENKKRQDKKAKYYEILVRLLILKLMNLFTRFTK